MKSLSLPNHWTTDLQLVNLSLKEMYFTSVLIELTDSSLLHVNGPYRIPPVHKTLGVNGRVTSLMSVPPVATFSGRCALTPKKW